MKNYLLSLAVLLSSCLVLTSCLGDSNENTGGKKEITLTTGVFILNEGSYYDKVNGSLSYIGYTSNFNSDQITNGLFYTINNRYLGGTPNDIILAGSEGEVYIACTDENRVEILDSNLKSIAFVEMKEPRRMAADESYVYVTSYDGTVSAINIKTHKIEKTTEVIGAGLEGIAVRNDLLYVCNSHNRTDYSHLAEVVKVKTSSMEKVGSLKVALNPTKIKLSGNNLYLLSSGNFKDVKAEIQKIDASDNVSYLCDGTHFDVVNNNLAVINAPFGQGDEKPAPEYFVLNSKGAKITFKPGIEILSPCAIAIDPNYGYVYISSYTISTYGYAAYSAPGYVCRFDLNNGLAKKFDAGVGPTGFLFAEAKYISE